MSPKIAEIFTCQAFVNFLLFPNIPNIALCARMQYGYFLEGALRAPSKK
jgi:hypothetical protein